MSKDLSIANNNDIEITSPPSLLRKTIASIALYSYVLSFVISPVYASTAEVIPPVPSTFHRHYYESDVDDVDEDFKDVSVPIEAPLQQQFRLWSSLPPLMHKALRFDEVYQPAGWNSHYQVSLGFEDTHSQGVLNIPSSKDFVNLAGAQWLQNVYGSLGWHCYLEADKFEADKSALSFSYRPGGRDETIAFSLNQRGHVRLSALNARGGAFYTTGSLSLAFTDDTVIPPQLIVAAPIIRNETELTTDHLQLFAQEHINRGGYKLEQGEINAHYTENHQPINITKSFSVSGYSWKNLADITGNGAIALHLQGALDNRSKTIRSTDHLTLLAESINNENGTLEAKNFVLHLRRDLNNDHGKVLSEERVDFRAANFFSHTGLIRSLEGLDLRNVDHSYIGGIETHGDVFLKEGNFTLTPASAMGNPDAKTQHKINRLVIEPNPVSPSLVMELLGTIKARFFQAFKSAVLGKDITIDNVEAELDAKLTFLPGQIKRLKTYLKDNPLSLDYIEDLEQLEWLLLSEADILPYDINTAGKLIVRAAPTATLPQWPITRNARAFKGLELHLPITNVVMGDAKGESYPEWIADTGPLLWYLNSLDQKSGKILAKAGGGIETQERMKFGEVHKVKTALTKTEISCQGLFRRGNRTTKYYYKHNLEMTTHPASLGAGGEFILKSHTNDIDFCFAHVELNRFVFSAQENISFLSSKMKTTAGGLLQGRNLFLKPDDKYLPLYNSNSQTPTPLANQTGYMQRIDTNDSGCYSNRHEMRLVKDRTFVFIDGDLTLDISESIKPIASFGVASGKLHNVTIPRQPIKPESINETYHATGWNCHIHHGHCTHEAPAGSFPSGLMTSDQMMVAGHSVILQGITSGPVITILTNDFQSYIVGNRRPQLAATPATLHDLSHYVGFSPFHRANPNPLGPSIIHDFVRMAAPPSVYYHHGRFSSAPLPGARQRYDHPILAQAMVEALVSQLKECYIQPHTSFSHNYLLANLNSVKALANIKRLYPELVDETHMLPALPGTEKSTFEIARKAERVTERFGDQPAILHVLEEDGQYTSYLHTPASSVHRSLKRSEALLLGREKILIAPLDASQPSSTYIAGAAIDSGPQGIMRINTDHNYFGPHRYTEITYVGRKGGLDVITEERNHNAYIGGTIDIRGETQDFEGTQMHLDGDSAIEGRKRISIRPSYNSTTTQSTSSSRNAFGGQSTKSSISWVQQPELATIEGETGNERLTIKTDGTAALTAPNLGVETTLEAQNFALGVAHRQSSSSSVSHSSDPLVQTTTIRSHTSDEAIAGQMPKGLHVTIKPGGKATIEHPESEEYPNLHINLGAEVEHRQIPNVFTFHEETHTSPGVATLGALGLAGAMAGGWAFSSLFSTAGTAAAGTAAAGTAATATTATWLSEATMLTMAKAATVFVGSSLFQGIATGRLNVDPRGLGVAIVTAGLIDSAPNLDAKATFMDNLATQVVHELKAAPTRMAINTTIGGERFEDAAISTLRQGTSHAIGATLAHQIGQLYQGPDKLGYITHKLAHFASGALTGTIMANDPFGGAFSAAFAEVAMEAMVDAEKEAKAIYQENPTLSIPEVEALMKERIMLRRYFSQVIGGFVGTIAGDGNFGIAASTAAIALDYNMEPTLTSAATAAYLAQQAPALAAFLTTPPGIAVAASLGIVALSIDQIKENLQLLGQLYQVYVMVLRGEINADATGRLYNTKNGDQVNQSTLFSNQSSAAGGMPDPDDDEGKRKTGCSKTESPIWKKAESYKGKYKRSADGKEIYKWDHTHNEIEVFHPKTGKHLGVRDPITGVKIKDGIPGRIEPGVK